MTVFPYTLSALLVLASYLPVEAVPAGNAQQAASAAGVSLPAGYRDWRMISVARKTGSLDDTPHARRLHRRARKSTQRWPSVKLASGMRIMVCAPQIGGSLN